MAIKPRGILTEEWFEEVGKEMQEFMKSPEFKNGTAEFEGVTVVGNENASEEEVRLSYNRYIRETYQGLMDGTVLSVRYPGGPGQLMKDVESGMYDD